MLAADAIGGDAADPRFLRLKVKLQAEAVPPPTSAYEDNSASENRAHKGFLTPFPCAFLPFRFSYNGIDVGQSAGDSNFEGSQAPACA